MNNYQLLGLNKDAKTTDIKRAYFKKVKEYSPEKNPEMFMEIRKAYDILLDKDLRAEYDSTLNLPDDERISLSKKFENEGNLKKAIQLMKAVADSYPDSWEAKELLGKLYEEEGSFGNAVKVYDGLTKEFPSNQKYAFCLASCLLKRGFNKKADAQFEKTIEINNSNADIWYEWISMVRVPGHSFKAISLIKRAEAVNEDIFKNNYDIYAELWLCQVMEGITSYDLFYKFISFYENGNKFVGDDILFDCLKVILEYRKPQKEYDKEAFEKGMKSAAVNVTEENRHKFNYLELRYYFGDSSASDVDAAIHDLTSMKLELEKSYNKDLENEIVAVKMFILSKFSKLKGQILKLQQEKPRFYALNKDFYEQIMDTQRRKALEKSVKKQINSAGFDEDMELSALLDELDVDEPYVREEPKVGRNDSCPCGSGKKYKRCCGG